MTRRLHVPLTVVAAAVVLVGGANLAAYAANGQPILLGSTNTESATATVANSGSGAALKLSSPTGVAPLSVSNNTKVARLNADLVDGLDSTQLTTVPTSYSDSADIGMDIGPVPTWSFPISAGSYSISYSVGVTPEFPADVVCGLTPNTAAPDPSTGFGWQSVPQPTSDPGAYASGTAVHTFSSATTATFFCYVTGSANVLVLTQPLIVTVLKLNGVTPGVLTGP